MDGKSPMKRKENDLNQTSSELCSSRLSSGVYIKSDLSKPASTTSTTPHIAPPDGWESLARHLSHAEAPQIFPTNKGRKVAVDEKNASRKTISYIYIIHSYIICIYIYIIYTYIHISYIFIYTYKLLIYYIHNASSKVLGTQFFLAEF